MYNDTRIPIWCTCQLSKRNKRLYSPLPIVEEGFRRNSYTVFSRGTQMPGSD